MEQFRLASIDEAIEDFKAGKFVIVVDDEDRENEGDLIMAAELATPEAVNFMLRCGRGVLCAAWGQLLRLHADRLRSSQSADELGLSAHMGGLQACADARSV